MAFEDIFDALSNCRLVRKLRRRLIPKNKRQPWMGDMVIEECGYGERIKYPGYRCSSTKIRWVSRERSEDGQPLKIREPREQSFVFTEDGGFDAAGKHYKNIRQLFARVDETFTWCRDKYGREVLYLIERFPCFDYYDTMYEDRCYRWFFLREGERLTRIFTSDDSWEIYVTEDVENLESGRWEEMQELGYFD